MANEVMANPPESGISACKGPELGRRERGPPGACGKAIADCWLPEQTQGPSQMEAKTTCCHIQGLRNKFPLSITDPTEFRRPCHLGNHDLGPSQA